MHVFDEDGLPLLWAQVTSNGQESSVKITDKFPGEGINWELVSTAIGAVAFWLWSEGFKHNIFPELLKGNEEPPVD